MDCFFQHHKTHFETLKKEPFMKKHKQKNNLLRFQLEVLRVLKATHEKRRRKKTDRNPSECWIRNKSSFLSKVWNKVISLDGRASKDEALKCLSWEWPFFSFFLRYCFKMSSGSTRRFRARAESQAQRPLCFQQRVASGARWAAAQSCFTSHIISTLQNRQTAGNLEARILPASSSCTNRPRGGSYCWQCVFYRV